MPRATERCGYNLQQQSYASGWGSEACFPIQNQSEFHYKRSDGLTTLREAIIAANATPAVADTITFNLGAGAHTINLNGALPDLSTNMTIQGPGANLLTVRRDTGGNYGIFRIASGTVTLAGLAIMNGLANSTQSWPGGGVSNSGTLTISDCIIRNNSCIGSAGGIYSFGTLTVNNSSIDHNNASTDGGGIQSRGTSTINDCTISDNSSAMRGGGYFNEAGEASLNNCAIHSNNASYAGGAYNQADLTITNSTLSGNAATGTNGGAIGSGGSLLVSNTTLDANTAYAHGGAIYTEAGFVTVSITQNTLTANSAQHGIGGAVCVAGVGGPTIDHCTIAGNNADGNINGYEGGGGIASVSLYTSISNSIIAGNTAPTNPDVVGNLNNPTFNYIGGDPKLAPLADNGGPTYTMALLANSPCINRGDPNYTGTPAFDQRGTPFARKVGVRIDIGAFESDVLNGIPTAASIPPLWVLSDAPDSVINLRDFFDDPEDGAAGLVYTIVGNTNPALFTTVSIDNVTDALTLDFAEGVEGFGTITIRGADSEGLHAETSVTVNTLLQLPNHVVNSIADNSTPDDGLTTLREAIIAANATPTADTITFDLGPGAHTINLAGALPNLADVDIQGPGADLLTIRPDTGQDYVIFWTKSLATVSLAGMTISNAAGGIHNDGTVTVTDCDITSHDGNGIYNSFFRTLTVSHCTISNNTAGQGGGIHNAEFGSVTLEDSALSGNTAGDGGGIWSGGQLSITRCTIGGNAAQYGGGISQEPYESAASLVITDSTISGNSAELGGGIFTTALTTIVNSTLTGNMATPSGGAAIIAWPSLVLNNCTISANNATGATYGGAVFNVESLTANNTVIAANAGGDIVNDVDATADTSNHNFIGSDHPGVDPQLGPLSDNGGPTKTMALLQGSPCINTGDPNFTPPPNYDQRGATFARVFGGRLDIGAFEYQNATVAPDFDQDGDVDSDDLAHLAGCRLGPGVPQNNPICADARLDSDDDVDLDDFGIFQRCYSGSAQNVNPNCAN